MLESRQFFMPHTEAKFSNRRAAIRLIAEDTINVVCITDSIVKELIPYVGSVPNMPRKTSSES